MKTIRKINLIRVECTPDEIVALYTTNYCDPWVETDEVGEDCVQLGCECGHCDTTIVDLVQDLTQDEIDKIERIVSEKKEKEKEKKEIRLNMYWERRNRKFLFSWIKNLMSNRKKLWNKTNWLGINLKGTI